MLIVKSTIKSLCFQGREQSLHMCGLTKTAIGSQIPINIKHISKFAGEIQRIFIKYLLSS